MLAYTKLFQIENSFVYDGGMGIRTSQTLLTRNEVAQRLGVSGRRVNMLRASGALEAIPAGNGMLFTEDSVRRQARWQGMGGRPYSSGMAFAALYLLSGLDVPWLGRQQRCRLNVYLNQVDAESLTRLIRKRATMIEYWCRESNLGRVTGLIRLSAATGELADSFRLTATNRVEGYITASALDDVVRQCRLKSGVAPVRVRLRVSDDLPEGDGAMPLAVCAADLAESSDLREQRAGLEALQQFIDEYNRKERRS